MSWPFSSDDNDDLFRPTRRTQPAAKPWTPPPPSYLAVISPGTELRWAVQTALASENSNLQLSSATTLLKFLEPQQQTPMTVRAVVFQPPSTIPKKVQRALDELCRLFPKSAIILLTDALGGDERATIFPRNTPLGTITDHLRRNVFRLYSS